MLVRKQILLEAKQVFELEALAAFHDMSFSAAMREGANLVTKKIKKQPTKKKLTQYEALDKWIAGAVSGPGDSEYDKYAYDL